MRFPMLLVFVAACGKGDQPPPPSSNALLTQESGPSHGTGPSNAQPSADDPAVIYRNQCAMCHGNTGKGDGISAGALTVKPRDYSDPKWQASVTDDDIKRPSCSAARASVRTPRCRTSRRCRTSPRS
jgi:cytochrome c553